MAPLSRQIIANSLLVNTYGAIALTIASVSGKDDVSRFLDKDRRHTDLFLHGGLCTKPPWQRNGHKIVWKDHPQGP